MNNRISHLPEDEAAQLDLAIRLIGRELDEAREEVRRKSGEFPRLYAEYHSNQNKSGESTELTGDELTGLRDADFGRLVDAAGFLTFLYDKQSIFRHTLRNAAMLTRLSKSPYFGRFDFQNHGEEKADIIYLGRHGLTERESNEIIIYDWRSPVASVFYRFGRGPAEYDAPAGRITGDVLLKRQYKFENGELLYLFDIDIQISDDMLALALAQNTTGRMRDIVETIQREQDTAIRDCENGLLMIQGAAGSGKTSIALHRTAYLLYESGRDGLRSQDILLLTPNAMFGRYISDVLPELGEENIVYADFEDIYNQIIANDRFFDIAPEPEKDLQNDRYQQEYYEFTHAERLAAERAAERERENRRLCGSREQMLEHIVTAAEGEADILRQSAAFKGSEDFRTLLERYLLSREDAALFDDIVLCGHVVYPGDRFREEFLDNGGRRPAEKRISRIAGRIRSAMRDMKQEILDDVAARLKASPNTVVDVRAEARHIYASERLRVEQYLKGLSSFDAREVYLGLFSDETRFFRLAEGLDLPPGINEILRRTAAAAPSYEDAAGILYLNAQLRGTAGFERIRQVMVDEAQDYYPLQYEVLRLYFSQARFTVMGDVAQSLERSTDVTLYEDIRRILAKKKSALISFSKSYRSTREITEYAASLLPHTRVQPFERHGEPVETISSSQGNLLTHLRSDIHSLPREELGSIAVLCRSLKAARALHSQLGGDVRLMESSLGDIPEKGITIMPVYLSKGLEFDAVLVWDPDGRSFSGEDGRRLLYVACTRALHVLRLYRGSKLIE